MIDDTQQRRLKIIRTWCVFDLYANNDELIKDNIASTNYSRMRWNDGTSYSRMRWNDGKGTTRFTPLHTSLGDVIDQSYFIVKVVVKAEVNRIDGGDLKGTWGLDI